MLLDGKVCHKCFDDTGISDFIKAEGKLKGCDYCKSKAKSHEISEVIEHINNCICTEYEDPANSMGWDGREGGYQGASTYDSSDLLDEIGLYIENDDLRELVVDNLVHELWCHREPYQLTTDEELIYGWERFSKTVKHKCRYMFLKHEKVEQERSLDKVLVSRILDILADLFINHDMVVTLKSGKKIYRGRPIENDSFPMDLENLFSPPPELSKSSRMSPAGIPLLYAANEKETAIAEIGLKNSDVVICKFEVLSDIQIVDLTKVPPVPSFFSHLSSRFSRPELIFLNNFLRDFIKPITKDGREHIEYVPTQIVSEYCKYNLKHKGKPIKGFAYPSSKHQDGISYCLFVDKYEAGAKLSQYLTTPTQILRLMPHSIKVHKV